MCHNTVSSDEVSHKTTAPALWALYRLLACLVITVISIYVLQAPQKQLITFTTGSCGSHYWWVIQKPWPLVLARFIFPLCFFLDSSLSFSFFSNYSGDCVVCSIYRVCFNGQTDHGNNGNKKRLKMLNQRICSFPLAAWCGDLTVRMKADRVIVWMTKRGGVHDG